MSSDSKFRSTVRIYHKLTLKFNKNTTAEYYLKPHLKFMPMIQENRSRALYSKLI